MSLTSRLYIGALIAILLRGTGVADPTFTVSTFDTGLDGWKPDKWATSTFDGLTPGNPYLNMAADGITEIGKVVTFNQSADWQGNYIASGVTGLELDIINRSTDDDVYLRVALSNVGNPQQTSGTWYLTKESIFVPTESEWTHVSIGLEESDMKKVGNLEGGLGPDSYFDVATNVFTIRILSSVLPFGAIGDEFVGDVGVDNIALVPEPSTMPLIGLGGVLIYYGRRRRMRNLCGELSENNQVKVKSLSDFLKENRFEPH